MNGLPRIGVKITSKNVTIKTNKHMTSSLCSIFKKTEWTSTARQAQISSEACCCLRPNCHNGKHRTHWIRVKIIIFLSIMNFHIIQKNVHNYFQYYFFFHDELFFHLETQWLIYLSYYRSTIFFVNWSFPGYNSCNLKWDQKKICLCTSEPYYHYYYIFFFYVLRIFFCLFKSWHSCTSESYSFFFLLHPKNLFCLI